jgi:hypothetical protein
MKKEQIQVQYRNGARDVFLFGIKNVLYLKKMFFFQGQIMIFA